MKIRRMAVNYVSDSLGETIAVQIPISDWKKIKKKYPDVDDLDHELPDWQKKLIDNRLKTIDENPSAILDVKGLFEELDRELI
jgi:hypothetical protein